MFSKTQFTLEQFTLQFSTLLKLNLYEQYEIIQLQNETLAKEREFSETQKYFPTRSEQYAKFLFKQQQDINDKFTLSFSGESQPKELFFSKKRGVEVLNKQIQKANDYDICLMVITVLTEFKLLDFGKFLFDKCMIKFPSKSLPYIYKAKLAEDISISRRIYQQSYQNINDFPELILFYGNWINLELQFIEDLIGQEENKIDLKTIKDESLKEVIQGKLIKEVLCLAFIQILCTSIFVRIPEQQRIKLQSQESITYWKLSGINREDILQVNNINIAINKFSPLLKEFEYLIKDVMHTVLHEIAELKYDSSSWTRSFEKCDLMQIYIQNTQQSSGESDMGED
ncbi:hypothetical protein SS50377_22182 [Spironucleus salmonicida]|uniref:Uncharacterized protein n=1 Tax=Spironucleus salmonicida TaxID=348837 RepID=V6LLU0_9EUKA|nr:hypothetical protein SS50377_22182 [Spironucleus salmonicida]|eukprot:EST45657.1 Hypothetical protein SS50377_14229 [Spironucleus salmonicida]